MAPSARHFSFAHMIDRCTRPASVLCENPQSVPAVLRRRSGTPSINWFKGLSCLTDLSPRWGPDRRRSGPPVSADSPLRSKGYIGSRPGPGWMPIHSPVVRTVTIFSIACSQRRLHTIDTPCAPSQHQRHGCYSQSDPLPRWGRWLTADSASSIPRAQMAAFGAARPLPCAPAKVSFLNPQPALSLGSGNWQQ